MLALIAALPCGDAGAGDERLGGRVTVGDPIRARWCWSGTFRYPVGDPLQLGREGPGGVPGYGVNRNVGERSRHQGADLDNRRGGDPVRATAHGLVVTAASEGWGGGYGAHVVIAHRLMDESTAFSVYAHLAPGSIRLRIGEPVRAGQIVGRVGRSGRATTEHLHFEIRQPEDPDQPWERARAVDPIAFVTARLPMEDDTSSFAPYFEWAEEAGLVFPGARSDDTFDHARWWTVLAHAAAHDAVRLPDDPAGLEPLLIDAGVLPVGEPHEASDEVGWSELQRDLDRMRKTGLRLFPIEIERDLHRSLLASALSRSRESARRPPPTLADALVMLAEVAGIIAPDPARERRRIGS